MPAAVRSNLPESVLGISALVRVTEWALMALVKVHVVMSPWFSAMVAVPPVTVPLTDVRLPAPDIVELVKLLMQETSVVVQPVGEVSANVYVVGSTSFTP